jgi:CSLREA domain-containing protein
MVAALARAAARARHLGPAAVGVGMRARRWSYRWGTFASTLGLLLGLLSPPPPAGAASFVVTTTADAAQTGSPTACNTALGQCTLRAAVQAVNNLGGGPHVIFLQAPGTYLLTLGKLSLDGVNVGIQNTSAGSVAVDGNQAGRVFDVGPNAAAQVTIAGVTIRNGKAFEGAACGL